MNTKKVGRPKRRKPKRNKFGKFHADQEESKEDTVRTDYYNEEEEKDVRPPVHSSNEEKITSVCTGDETKEQTGNIPTPSPQFTQQKEKTVKIHPTHLDFTIHEKIEDSEVEENILPEVCSDSEIDSDSSCSSEQVKKETFYGNRILPLESLTSKIRDNLWCQFCYENTVESDLNNFMDFLTDEKLISSMNKKNKNKIVNDYFKNRVKKN